MKKILLFLVLIFVIGCQVEGNLVSEPATVPSVDSVSLMLDKDLYHSGEIIHIDANVNSEMVLNNVTVRFYGIHASRYRLDNSQIVDLDVGDNKVVLDYKAPPCYGCAGIKPGTYYIKADVIYQEEVLGTASVDIEIRQ